MLATVALLSTGTASADDLTRDSRPALQQLVAQNPAAAKVKSEVPQAFRRKRAKECSKKDCANRSRIGISGEHRHNYWRNRPRSPRADPGTSISACRVGWLVFPAISGCMASLRM